MLFIEKKTASVIIVTLLLTSMLSLAFNIRTVRAQGAIYIRPDGSIEGTANIQTADNVTYVFTANINDLIIVERNNIVIDGNGYTLQGNGSISNDYNGIDVSLRNNITIKNTQIKAYYCGIKFDISSGNTVSGNNITANSGYGVWLVLSNNNRISGNNITKSNIGIELYYSSNNSVSGNNITANTIVGIELVTSLNDTIYHNKFISNSQQVFGLNSSDNLWDDGYPSGGNYWSDYQTKYLNASEIDSSGIWNTPYVIDAHNTDHYPLMTWPMISGATVNVANAVTGSRTIVDSPGDKFTVNVSIRNAPSNLEGYEYRLLWNASVLNCTSYTSTPPQEWGSNVFIGKDELNRTNADGTQSYWISIIATVFGVNVAPNHLVNTFNFTVVGTGITTIAFPTEPGGNPCLGDWYAINIPCTGVDCTVSAVARALVGVKSGDWIKYDYTISGWPAGTPYPLWLKMEFLSVEGTNATVRVTMHISNGTEQNTTVPVDVVAGGQAFGLSGLVIPANLTTGDSIYMSGYGNVTIAGETTGTYAGASRTVVYTNFSQYGTQLAYYWDKQTGVMVEASTTSGTMTGTAKATETDMWQAIPEFPSFLVLPLFVFATLLAVMVYRRKTEVSDVM